MTRRLCSEDHYPQALLAVAGHGLPDARRAFPVAPLGEDDWGALVRGALVNRLVGSLRAAVDDGAIPASAQQAGQVRALHREAMLRVLALEGGLLQVVDLLSEAGIQSRALKGAAVAHLDYADPAQRSFVDIDVLVRPTDIDDAVGLLSGAGFTRRLAEPRPGFDRRFDKGTTLVSPAGDELDLHRTFVLGPWGVLLDLDAIWEPGEQARIGGRAVTALSPRMRFVHACYHASLGDWPLRLASLRDVAEMLRRVDGNGDGTDIVELVTGWGVAAVVAAAVTDAGRLLGIGSGGEIMAWAERYVPTRRDESRLALHQRVDKTFAAQAVATLGALPLAERPAYLRTLLFPDQRYTAGRHRSVVARLLYGLREARRGRRT